jgi:hypothetical protein
MIQRAWVRANVDVETARLRQQTAGAENEAWLIRQAIENGQQERMKEAMQLRRETNELIESQNRSIAEQTSQADKQHKESIFWGSVTQIVHGFLANHNAPPGT